MANFNYLDNLGSNISMSTTVEEALMNSGLDFEVKKIPTYIKDETTGEFHLVGDDFCTVRTDLAYGHNVLGSGVGNNYTVMQNNDSFKFIDGIISEVEGIKFHRGGIFNAKRSENRADGSSMFLSLELPETHILDEEDEGEKYKPYLLFTNSHDGSSRIRAAFTPIRIACSNTIMMAYKSAFKMGDAQMNVQISHTPSMERRLITAQNVMKGYEAYMEELRKKAKELNEIEFSQDQFTDWASEKYLIPLKETDSRTVKERAHAKFEALTSAWLADNLGNFSNTAWKALQAVADYESHPLIFRETEKSKEAALGNVLGGMSLTNEFARFVIAA